MKTATNLRGMAFANFLAESRLAHRLIHEHDFIMEKGSEPAEKDYGDGAVAHFECGQAIFMREKRTISIYQSRVSDSWNIEDNRTSFMKKPEFLFGLKDRDQLNDDKFIDELFVVMNLMKGA